MQIITVLLPFILTCVCFLHNRATGMEAPCKPTSRSILGTMMIEEDRAIHRTEILKAADVKTTSVITPFNPPNYDPPSFQELHYNTCASCLTAHKMLVTKEHLYEVLMVLTKKWIKKKEIDTTQAALAIELTTHAESMKNFIATYPEITESLCPNANSLLSMCQHWQSACNHLELELYCDSLIASLSLETINPRFLSPMAIKSLLGEYLSTKLELYDFGVNRATTYQHGIDLPLKAHMIRIIKNEITHPTHSTETLTEKFSYLNLESNDTQNS